MFFHEFFGLVVCSISGSLSIDDPHSRPDPHTWRPHVLYLKAPENELIPDVETLSLNLDMPTPQHFTLCKK